jgi:hypothetical protein
MRDMSTLQEQLRNVPNNILRNRLPIFMLVVILTYGFIALRVNTLSGAEPNENAVVSSESNLPQPHIDEVTVNKIQQLQNNSVNVQALFNQARQDPFQE